MELTEELTNAFEDAFREAIDLDSHDVRSVRGKVRGYNRINADYQEEADGTLTFLGYSVIQSITDFTAEVNKTADRAIDFGHFYHVRRQVLEIEDNGYESDLRPTYVVPNPDFVAGPHVDPEKKYLVNVKATGLRGHFETENIPYSAFKAYVGELYKEEQTILKTITNIVADKYKGASGLYNKNPDVADQDTSSIRGGTKAWTGAKEDYSEIDIITEIELLLVDIFDHIDNVACDDSVKLDFIRMAADTIARKRLGITSAIAHRATPKGEGKIGFKAHTTKVADALIRDMANYTVNAVDEVPEDRTEYYNDLAELRKSIAAKDSDENAYHVSDEGKVIPRIRTAKKRGDGYSVFKNMSSKYRAEHADQIDDEDW